VSRKQKPVDGILSSDFASDGPASNPSADQDAAPPKKQSEGEEAPPWAAPLRDLYQQVVEEPLPDFLSDLLSRLDRESE